MQHLFYWRKNVAKKEKIKILRNHSKFYLDLCKNVHI